MSKLFTILGIIMLTSTTLHAAQSVIIETEGYACMGDDKSRKATEQSALQEAKRKASERAATYIESTTTVKDAVLEKDLVNAFANALVKVLQELDNSWYKDQASGDCYRIRVKAEVVPDERAMQRLAAREKQPLADDPGAPLNVKIWTERPSYAAGESVRIYLKGNKPFYGRVVYRQADGALVQLLPNPYRQAAYFNGGVLYELPSGEDRFTMETSSPFGTEQLTLYASTAPLGDIEVTPADAVYQISSTAADIPVRTRGIKLVAGSPKKPAAAEFAEAQATVTTLEK